MSRPVGKLMVHGGADIPGCGQAIDVGYVTVKARYADCTLFDCPGCGREIDDRPGLHLREFREEPVVDQRSGLMVPADVPPDFTRRLKDQNARMRRLGFEED